MVRFVKVPDQIGSRCRSSQRKLLSAAKKGARVGEKLVNEFGSDDQKRKVATGRKVAEIVQKTGAHITDAEIVA